MARLADIVVDCHRPASLARFWQALLDDYTIAPYDDAEHDRLAAAGITDTEDDLTVLLEPSGSSPRLWFQHVPEPKTVKNRMHFDVSVADVASEVQRLQDLGAILLADQRPTGLVVMSDPEGNEFCLIEAS